jgi:hypothetical protein
VVTKDILEAGIYVGNPARKLSDTNGESGQAGEPSARKDYKH